MNYALILADLVDKGGRRTGINRRRFAYTDHATDRRYRNDRRNGQDRRLVVEQRSGNDRRASRNVGSKFEEMRRGLDRRRDIERRSEYAAVFANMYYKSS